MASKLRQFVDHFFAPQSPLPPGTHHYQAPPDSPTPYRLHLRIATDGTATLIVNAKTVLHLNQTAAEYAFHIVKQTPQDEVANIISRRYRVPREQALADFRSLAERLETFVNTTDLDPVMYLDFEQTDMYPDDTVPYRLDCALTYRVSEGLKDAAPGERVKRELTTVEWCSILDKVWEAGIPHVIFTGGEPTLRPDLPDLVACAEKLGQVSGILTDGLRLTDNKFLHQLLQAGLDHLMLILDSGNAQSWEALKDVLAEDIHVTVHLTITPGNRGEVSATIKRLAEMGVKALSLSVSSMELKDQVALTRQQAAELDMTMVYDLPVPYSKFHPVALEMEDDEPAREGAGRAWLYVEPDGDVLPGQGINRVMGNLLTDPWEKIWENRT